MADAPAETRRVTQPTIAFHHQATVAVGPNDLARELFRQEASSTFRRPVAVATSWDADTATVARPRSRAGAWLVCLVCMFLGIAAGHVVREGRAYASSVGVIERAAAASRDMHVPSDVRATAQGVSRGKDAAPPAVAVRSSARPVRPHKPARATAQKSIAPIALDALFVDFEPTFRVDR